MEMNRKNAAPDMTVGAVMGQHLYYFKDSIANIGITGNGKYPEKRTKYLEKRTPVPAAAEFTDKKAEFLLIVFRKEELF